MGVGYNYNCDSAYIDGVAKGQYKRWFSWCERYAGFGALEKNPTKISRTVRKT
jgi:hypothetical protein